MTRPAAIALLFFLAACHRGEKADIVPAADRAALTQLGVADTLHFAGIEPPWAGEIVGGALAWKSADNRADKTTPVERFAGRNGLGFSGTLDGGAFELAVSNAPCSDGTPARTYPFTVTALAGGRTLRGCGWSDARTASRN